MKISIRSKLIILISLLVIVLFSLAAMLFINEKKEEMAEDIFVNSLAFSKLSAATVAENCDLYLEQGAFVYFNREIQGLFSQNDDLAGIEIVTYSGEVLYDSELDRDKKYEGEARIAEDSLLEQLKSENISLRTEDDVIYFIKDDEFVDYNERALEKFERGTKIASIIVPVNEEFSVVYSLHYENLDERVAVMVERILYLLLLGVLMGILFSFFMAKGVTRSVLKLVDAADKIAKGDFKTRVFLKSKDEIGFLGQSFNKMAEDLEESMEAKLYKERVAKELELAEQIQKQIVPNDSQIPKMEGIEIAAGLISAAEIGGDMYDFLPVRDDRLLMYLGDVTGHGVPAGIVSAIASSLFYSYAEVDDLKKIMIEVNRVLKEKTMPNMFMTLCLMEWDASDKKFSYLSAGHEKLIHYSAKDGKVKLTSAGGIALGMMPNISHSLNVEVVDFKKGDALVIYSDGIPEAWKNEKENYGIDRFVKTVGMLGASETAEEMKQGILKDLKTFVGDFEQKDDITLIVIKRV